ncbi:hypothetical protein BCR33DRAFT_681595 [Rhizoclosmatium globosum]|uniref:CNH domain-containing protein n=1 Tax=Rhizoclosmatium globosum TaxID=329046 RepID=A0A1Y2BZ10_9FUNG|nr:hypothetical protein BCR33DRAFT_681595 [Rhizoclosmatium globosum]|eukprot:ORY39991.1 hypothetical protein BCR33DRAFT_681595 [Rhizoclosmatium globosum]
MMILGSHRGSHYLCIALESSVIVAKWAGFPENQFVTVATVPLSFRTTSLNLIETAPNELFLFLGDSSGHCHSMDLSRQEISPIEIPHQFQQNVGGVSRVGKWVKSVSFSTPHVQENILVLCFEKMGLVDRLGDDFDENEVRSLGWRNQVSFVVKFGTKYIVAGSTSVIDVINVETGKVVHVFATSMEKIRALRFLTCHGNKLFLQADEVKDGNRIGSILCIEITESII